MRLMLTASSLLLLSGVLGCETVSVESTRTDPMPPEPVQAPATPPTSPITNVVVICPYAMNDLNGDGLSAEFPIAVYLYAQPYPAPKWESGTCSVKLYPMGALRASDGVGSMLREWSWDAAEVHRAREKNLVGDFYRFEVDLTDMDPAEMNRDGFDFQVVFIPESTGMPCESSIKTVRMR